jgi:thiol:disulfide interchange protein DsbD
MSRFAFSLAAIAAVTLGAATTAQAQDPVKWTATPAAKTVAPGAKAAIKLDATIEDGWHIYSITQGPGGPVPTRITVPKDQPFTLDAKTKIKGNPPVAKFDENFGIQVETHENNAEFVVPVVVEKNAKSGAQKGQVSVRYQVCNESMCLPAKTKKVDVTLNVKGKSGK